MKWTHGMDATKTEKKDHMASLPSPDIAELFFDMVKNDQISHNQNLHRHFTDIKTTFCEHMMVYLLM